MTQSALGYPLPPWPHPLPAEPVLTQTQWGLLWLIPSDIVGRTLLGVQGDRDVREGISPARADGHFWDGDLLLPLYVELATPESAVIIVGANFGQDVLACAQLGARVLAVEANQILAGRLENAIQRNGYSPNRVEVLSYVAYDRPGWFRLDQPLPDVSSQAFVPAGASGPADRGWYRGGPLDPFVTVEWVGIRRLSLIQVDAQGCDLRVLKGLRETIRTQAPVIVFEYEADLAHAHGDTWADHEAWMYDQITPVYDWVESETHRNNWIGRPRA